MKKQTKYVAVLSAAALLAMGASMTSFAAGWEKDEAGAWHYYDKDDDMVTNEWKKDGGKWFYLDDDGNMVTNQWVEDDYYVGEDGAMITNGWVKTLEDDEDVDSPEDTGEHWYYFNTKGKKITNAKKTINGKTYHFDEDGKMLSGWQDDGDNVYYLGNEDEGWETRNQWRWLEKSGIDDDDEDPETGHAVLQCTEEDDCDDEGWYWFDNSGKLYHKSGLKTIKGKKFIFNEHGQMMYEWIYGVRRESGKFATPDSVAADHKLEATTADMYWFQENGDSASNGARYKGWQYISGSEVLGKDGDTNWYYFKDGKPKYADKANGLYALDDKDNAKDLQFRKKEKLSWDGKTGTFCFDDAGKMKTGLQYIDGHTYFFNDDGYMQTGKVSGVEEADGDTFNYYFDTKNATKGQGHKNEKDGYLYFEGKRLEADDDYRLYVIGDNYYVVNSKGKLQKTFTHKDLELPDGDVLENATLKIDKNSYKVTTTGKIKVRSTDSKIKDDVDSKYTLKDVAAVPHIRLDDTDNIITPFGIYDLTSDHDFLKEEYLTYDKIVNVDPVLKKAEEAKAEKANTASNKD